MLVAPKRTSVPAQPVILMVIVHVLILMRIRCALEALVQAHLGLVCMARAIQQAVILPVAAVVEHGVRVVGWRMRAGRSIRRGSVCGRLEETSTIGNRGAVAVM